MSDEEKNFTERVGDHLSDTSAVVLQGPPGTGKTYTARQLVEDRLEDRLEDINIDELDDLDQGINAFQWSVIGSGIDAAHQISDENLNIPDVADDGTDTNLANLPLVWDIVQLHPGYAYEDFVRGIETDTDSDSVEFVPKDRTMVQLAEVAKQLQEEEGKVILILDEINRASLSNVLGELILALEKDKRSSKDDGGWPIRLQYPEPEPDADEANPDYEPDGAFDLPENLWVIGTMNTADQSIAKVDYAIRRRFRFIDVPPDADQIWEYYTDHDDSPETKRFAAIAIALLSVINDNIESDALKVGHSYFLIDEEEIDGDNKADLLAKQLAYDVLPLLREYDRNGDLNLEDDDLDLGFTIKNAEEDGETGFKVTSSTDDENEFEVYGDPLEDTPIDAAGDVPSLPISDRNQSQNDVREVLCKYIEGLLPGSETDTDESEAESDDE